jgi:uncharacterized membrane protein
MLALRLAAVLGLVVWIGGVVVLGAVAAPALFDVLGEKGPEGRLLAGSLFGEIFGRFQVVAYISSAVVFGSLVVRAVLGPRPRRFALRVAVVAAMLGAAAWTDMVLIPQIEQTQRTLGALSETDPRRIEFGRLHRLSTSLQMVPLLGGLALLFFELKD